MNWELLLQLIVNGLILGTLYGVVAMCFTLIYKASQVVNFAQGEFLLIGAWVCWWLLADLQLPFWAAFPMTLAFMMVFGILLQVVLLRPMIGEPIISMIMVTIGLSIFFQAVMKWIFGVIVQPFPPIFEADAVSVFGLNVQPAYLLSLVVSLAIMGAFALQILAPRPGDAGHRLRSAGGAEPGDLGAEDVRTVVGDLGDGLGAGRCRLRHRQRRLLGAVAVRHQGVPGGNPRRSRFDRGRHRRRADHRPAGKPRRVRRRAVAERRQPLQHRPLLHSRDHPDDPPLRPVRHREDRTGLARTAKSGAKGRSGWRDTRGCAAAKTSYAADTTIFATPVSRGFVLFGIALLALLPLEVAGFAPVSDYWIALLIQIGYLGIAALGLNILVGFSGQISLGHSAFFGFGAFASAWLNNTFGIPVVLSMPLAGLMTTAVGMVFGIPAARIKGLYLAIATLASQFILQDFFARADWFSGGSAGALAAPFSLFGYAITGDRHYYYVVLANVVLWYLAATNLMRTRDGRALVAVRDHYLSAEVMGVNLTKYRILAFGISSFYAGIAGALYAHYLQYVSIEGFDLLLSIQFLGMIIIGGLGSVSGALMGTTFMVLLPEAMSAAVGLLQQTDWGNIPAITQGLAFLKQAAVGLAIVLFLIFEPDGLAHRWQLIKSSWRLYPFSY